MGSLTWEPHIWLAVVGGILGLFFVGMAAGDTTELYRPPLVSPASPYHAMPTSMIRVPPIPSVPAFLEVPEKKAFFSHHDKFLKSWTILDPDYFPSYGGVGN